MARTKQTARKSTEGKTPEKQVAAGSDQGASGGSTGQGATKAPSFPSKAPQQQLLQQQVLPPPPPPPPSKAYKGSGNKSPPPPPSKAYKSGGNKSIDSGEEEQEEEEDDFDEQETPNYFPKKEASNFQSKYQSPSSKLMDILNPHVLQNQKQKLHRITDPVTLTRVEILESSTDFGALSMQQCLNFLKTQSTNADVTEMKFGGTDQLTDALWYLLANMKITFGLVSHVSLTGCYHLTNAGVRWMTKVLPSVKYFEVSGCPHITEEGLQYVIWAWEGSLLKIDFTGTGVGVIPAGYETSIKLDGCPVLSPVMNVNLKSKAKDRSSGPLFPVPSYKMVFLSDTTIPYSPMAVFRGQKEVGASKTLKIEREVKIGDMLINMFEVPADSMFVDLLVSKGSIVVLPYPISADGVDPDYPEVIITTMSRIVATCPDVVFILLGLTSEDGSLDSVASQYRRLIDQQLTNRGDKLEEKLDESTKRDLLLGRLFFFGQQHLMHGRTLFDRCEGIVNSSEHAWARSGASPLIASTYMSVNDSVDAASQRTLAENVLKSAIKSLTHHFPWYFTPHHKELHKAVVAMDTMKFKVTGLKAVAKEVREKDPIWKEFGETNTKIIAVVGKVLDFMGYWGKVLYYPDIAGGCGISDYAFLLSVYATFLDTTPPSVASWRYLGTKVPCWTAQDISAAFPDQASRELLLVLLESRGVLLCLPKDQWTTEIEATHAYVVNKHLPRLPCVDLETFWQEAVPVGDYEVERYFTFMPGVANAFFPSVIRDCLQLGDVRLLWKQGVVIQKGPIMILLEMLNNLENYPTLFIGVRLLNCPLKSRDSNPLMDILLGNLRVYKAVIEERILHYKLYAHETIPCSTCLPSKNRYKTVNARQAEVFMVSEQFLVARAVQGRDVTCGNDGSQIARDDLGNKSQSLREIVPRHFFLGCLPSFSGYNRCMFCGNCAFAGALCEGNLKNGKTARNCSCQREGQMCDRCGLCQRCVLLLASKEGALSPKFQRSGSVVNPHLKEYFCEQELTPNFSPLLEIMPLETNDVTIRMQMGSIVLHYELKTGKIEEVFGSACQQLPEFVCEKGYRVTLKLEFNKDDFDEMQLTIDLLGSEIFTYRTSTQSCEVSLSSTSPGSVIIYMPRTKRLDTAWIDEYGEKVTCSYTPGIEESQLTCEVFISCSKEDLPLAKKLSEYLLRQGFSTLITKAAYTSEGPASTSVGYSGARVVILCWSAAYLIDQFTWNEAFAAYNSKKSLVPVPMERSVRSVGRREAWMDPLVDQLKYNFDPVTEEDKLIAFLQEKLTGLGVQPGKRGLANNRVSLHSALEAKLLAGKAHVENTLFQTGGINYSGASFITLPRQIHADLLKYPSLLSVKEDQSFRLLCYTRSKISDAMSFGGGQAVPESWSVYRMIHLLDSAGVHLDSSTLTDLYSKAGQLLWAWLMIFRMLPQVELPKNVDKFLPADLIHAMQPAQLDAGLRDLLEVFYWHLLTCIRPLNLLDTFNDSTALLKQAQVLQAVSKENLAQTGCMQVESKLNTENVLFICEGHEASVRMEEGLVTILPEVYGKYSMFLLSVDVPANKMTELPEELFTALPNLAEFDCSNNFLEAIPGSIGKCRNLYSLSCANNNLRDLPATLTQCKGLQRLDISENLMAAIPPVVPKLTSLQRLYANSMFLTALPENIGNLYNLEKLFANGNCFTSLPESFSRLQSLNDLGLYGVPWLPALKPGKVMSYEQFLAKLKMWKLDRWLEAPEHKSTKDSLFKFFDQDSNGVLDADEVGKLNAYLFSIFPRFGYKGIEPPEDDTPSGFPMEILECHNLEYINLYFQGFVSVPPEIGNLQELKMFNVSHNPNLLTIPAEVGTISCLTRLELESCPLLKTPPKEIRAKGFTTTFAYLRRLMSGSLPCKRTKLMLVGLGGAGKTSLVQALLSKDKKANLTHGEAITDGIDISNWTVRHNDESLTFSVWDFAGQTVYYNTHQFFLSNRAVYLLLWNVRLGYEHAGLDFWLSSITVQAPKAPIFVVGSHVDQVSKYEIPMNEMRARYKQIAGFYFVSSYTGQGIEELQRDLFEKTLEQQYMGEQIPEVWLQFENNVIAARTDSNVIEYSALEKMANASGVFDKTEVFQAVQFLNDLGSLQHFTTESLKSKVVINPQWIVDVMACVVSVKNSPIQDGVLKHSDIGVVWKDYPAELHDWLLKLTEAYDLTFPLDDKPVNLVPCLMPEKQPDLHWEDLDKDSPIKENKMIYKFDYLPAGLFNRGQVRLHQISDSALIWKRGSYLKKNSHVALLQQTRESELILRVQGPRPENIIFLVHEVFEGLISESFRGVTYDYQIPCPDCLKIGAKEQHMFSASTIRRAIALKSPFLQCGTYFHVTSCVDLQACMPPDSHSDFDLHLVQSIRNLRDLRKDLAADIFMSYCAKNAPSNRASVIHPATVHEDLTKAGYKCWFPKPNEKSSTEEMARAISDAAVFLVFMSVDYSKDQDCVTLFKYAKLTLRKPLVVVAVGENFEWQKGPLGMLLTDMVFVNMINSKREVYKSKFEELLGAISSKTNRPVGKAPIPSCFFSYTWVNSQVAVNLGTREIKSALGYGDPREIKKYLEDQGIKCWIDVERVGQNGLFDDIAEGLLNAKVVVVCVSDEYADSPTCCTEFRYAANTLNLPIILAVVGTGCRWRSTEVGVLSLKYPLVSFQEKSEMAYTKLVELVSAELNHEPVTKQQKNKQNEETKNLSFSELFELAQRKLLRQLAFYAEHQEIGTYPRLFVIDFMKSKQDVNPDEKTDEQESEKDGESSADQLSTPRRTLSKKVSDLKAAFRVQRYCVLTLCEHDEGWHVAADPLPLPSDFGENLLDKFCPFVSRMMAVMKFNKKLPLNCVQHEMGEDYMTWLEENPSASASDYQQIYHEFREMVITSDSQKSMGKLSRCRMANGKVIWLCEKHQSSMKVTVLSSEEAETASSEKVGNDDMTMINGLRAGFSNTNLPGTTGFASDMAKRDPEKLLDKKYQSNITRIQPSDIKPETSSKDDAFGKEKVMKSKGKRIRSAKKETEKESGLQLILPSEMAIESNQRKKESKDAHKEDVQNALKTEMEIAQDVGKVGNTGLSQAPVPAKVNDPSQGQSELGTRSNSQGQSELGTRSKTFFGMESKKEVEENKASSTQIRPRLERSMTQGPKEKLKSKACIVM